MEKKERKVNDTHGTGSEFVSTCNTSVFVLVVSRTAGKWFPLDIMSVVVVTSVVWFERGVNG